MPLINPRKENILELTDNCLGLTYKKLAQKWEENTKYKKDDLESLLYLGGAIGFGFNATYDGSLDIVTGICSGVLAGLAVRTHNRKKDQEFSLENEILSSNSIRNEMASINVLCSVFASIFLVTSGVDLAQGIISGNEMYYMNFMHLVTSGMAVLSGSSALYVSRIYLEKK